jgi:hypothetical protein
MFLFDLCGAFPYMFGDAAGLVNGVNAGFSRHHPCLVKLGTERPHGARNGATYLIFQTFDSAGRLKLRLVRADRRSRRQGHHLGGTAAVLKRF